MAPVVVAEAGSVTHGSLCDLTSTVAFSGGRVAFSEVHVAKQRCHCLFFLLKKMTKRREPFTHHAYRHYFFFVIAVDAPRRALLRDTATFSSEKRLFSGVRFTKRAFSKTRVLVHLTAFFETGASLDFFK